MMTPYLNVIKGRAEVSLLELSRTLPCLKVYSVRPGAVDVVDEPEIHPFLPPKKGLKKVYNYLLPTVKTLYPSIITPSRDLAKIMVELGIGDGDKLDGEGIDGEGRTISNKALGRLASH
jgi:hypothetical protein